MRLLRAKGSNGLPTKSDSPRPTAQYSPTALPSGPRPPRRAVHPRKASPKRRHKSSYESSRSHRRRRYHHRSWLSPINRAPNDVLLHIFSHLVRPKSTSLCVVAAVCRRWRGVALAHPSLWTQITHGFMDSPLELHRLKIQLQRSGVSMNGKVYPKIPMDERRTVILKGASKKRSLM